MDVTNSAKPILITGCARTGTSLLTLLMKGFTGLKVAANREISPLDYQPRAGRWVIKYPQGAQDPKADFGFPATWPNPEVCYLRHYLEDWQVLICVRDPRDVLVSKHPKDPTKYYVSPERCAGALARDIEALQHPNTLAVPYEKLVSDPGSVMAEIAAFIDEDYDYTVIDRFHQEESPDSQIAIALNSLRPIDQASVGNWRLPQHEQRLNEVADYYHQNIEPLMEQLGYKTAPDTRVSGEYWGEGSSANRW